MSTEHLDADAKARLSRLPADLRDVVAAALPTPEAEAQARRDQDERDRQRVREERQQLLQLADECELGVYGAVGVEVAKRLLASGRTNFALSSLRAAVRKLRLTTAATTRGPAAPTPASKLWRAK